MPNIHDSYGKLQDVAAKVKGDGAVRERCLYKIEGSIERIGEVIECALQIRLKFLGVEQHTKFSFSISCHLTCNSDAGIKAFDLSLNQRRSLFRRNADNLDLSAFVEPEVSLSYSY